jgi:hypothetical protein
MAAGLEDGDSDRAVAREEAPGDGDGVRKHQPDQPLPRTILARNFEPGLFVG